MSGPWHHSHRGAGSIASATFLTQSHPEPHTEAKVLSLYGCLGVLMQEGSWRLPEILGVREVKDGKNQNQTKPGGGREQKGVIMEPGSPGGWEAGSKGTTRRPGCLLLVLGRQDNGRGSIASDICHPHPWLPCSTLKSFLCLGKVFENYFHEELSEGIPQTPTQWRFMWPEADCISKVVLSRQSVGHTRNASMIPGEQREKRDSTNVCSSFSSSSLLIKRKISLEHKGRTKS